jgi:colanic acid/amylovoran biosynthesis glycosyltransferase
MRISYFINQYPKVSHTFIRREILALERQGFVIQRLALRGWGDALVDAEDIAEQKQTQYILKNGILGLVLAAFKVLFKQPVNIFKTFYLALRLGWHADRPILFHVVYFLEACQTYLLIDHFKSQHIHAHFGTNPSEIVMLTNALCGIPYSFTVHGPEEFDRPKFLKLKEKINQSKFVVAISSFGRSQLQRWVDFEQWDKIKVVHCGLEPSFYQVPSTRVPSKPRLVCVGRLCEQKGQLLLIEAAKSLNESGVDFELVLAGDGELRAPIEKLIAQYQLTDKVKITGWINSAEVRSHLLNSQALVLPSFAEGLPVVIMEAMSLKRAVISTYIAGIPELVKDQENGWLIPAGSVEMLTVAIQQLLNTPPEALNKMGEAAYLKVIERHNIDREAEKLALYFQSNGSF